MKQETARSIKSAQGNKEVESLAFTELPGQSPLFLEFLRDPTALKDFYPNVTGSLSDVRDFAGEVLANYRTDRDLLSDALAETNRQIGSGEKSFANIELLRSSQTVAVVTGQQAGLFAGPLYTIYKAMSAIKLADELSSSGTKAVPVFWIATEDHDFDEVAAVYVTGKHGEVASARYTPAVFSDGVSVGDIALDETIAKVVEDLFSLMPATEHSARVRDLIDAAYTVGTDLGQAFGKIMAALFADYGLVVVDPMNDRIKQLSSPIYGEAIQHGDEIVAEIRAQSTKLVGHGFHAQVLVEEDYFPLFWHDDDGKRKALKKIGDGLYRVKGGKREFATSELQELSAAEPSRFSPGVMLRGVVQDYLLPTICYFGGAAEIAYFAQKSASYRILKRPVTPISHRQSFTVVESRQRRALEKFGWELRTLFDGKERATLVGAADILSPKMAGLFADVEKKINAELDRLDQMLSESDVTLAANLATRRRKILYHIATLRKKALLAETKKDETMRRQIDDLFDSLLPMGGLQERSLNVFGFINKHGLGFIDLLYTSVDLNDKDHRIVYL